ncbi:uncharacterized protein N7473_010402 [Penicillium subrubescens]|uniref:uncharacterized protein n=1 Tax=Penicillium subrubescens TaxID=1316194 RepID=UPI002545AFD7|nr:uncharacterized protein N7473_010402 [Penicillium subrubescens]KAJ5883516.1 hypothetical protein N7473_010402 [Penicillium subrubescens]
MNGENIPGTITTPAMMSHQAMIHQAMILTKQRTGGSYRQGFHGHGPQSQPQPSTAMDAEWTMVPVELSIVPIGPPPPQCQARLYTSSVDSISLPLGVDLFEFGKRLFWSSDFS